MTSTARAWLSRTGGSSRSCSSGTGPDPGTTVFVDDVAANVAAAQSVGIGAVQYTSAQLLRRGLRALGLPLAR